MYVVGNCQKDLVGEVEQTTEQAFSTEETDRPNIDDAGMETSYTND